MNEYQYGSMFRFISFLISNVLCAVFVSDNGLNCVFQTVPKDPALLVTNMSLTGLLTCTYYCWCLPQPGCISSNLTHFLAAGVGSPALVRLPVPIRFTDQQSSLTIFVPPM